MSSLLNNPAPDFSCADQDGNMQSLASYKGKKVLLYFYPRDMTSGCTVEAQNFRDHYEKLQAAGVEVVGVSCDPVDSHKKFCEKESLPFTLLADVDKKMVNDYGVWVEKSMYGRKYMGIQRDSFLIDENGVVVKHYVKVKPKGHIDEVLKDLGL